MKNVLKNAPYWPSRFSCSLSFPQLEQAIFIPNQKEVFIQYLKSYELTPIVEDFTVRAEKAGVTLECKFDSQNRFHELTLQIVAYYIFAQKKTIAASTLALV